jgi:hypothetical protein
MRLAKAIVIIMSIGLFGCLLAGLGVRLPYALAAAGITTVIALVAAVTRRQD